MTNIRALKSCCAPARSTHSDPPTTAEAVKSAALRMAPDAIVISSAKALIGTRTPEIPDDGEDPVRETRVKSFRIGATTVTNAQFSEFIDATGYVTEAERFGWSFVFWAQVPESVGATQGVAEVEWWRRGDGANWRDINGPGTKAQAWHEDHPVVQISWNDAQAYAQ